MVTMIDIDEIKRLKDKENKSFREISLQTGFDRKTVSKWYNSNDFPKYKREKTKTPVKDQVLPFIQKWIEEDIQLIKERKKRKIRSASLMYSDLIEKGFDVCEASVRKYSNALKPKEVYIPLEYDPGIDMQVDWGKIDITFDGGKIIKVNIFVATLPYSNARFVYPYIKADSVSFFDAHNKAFSFFGGIPRRITYDNLSSAVKKVLKYNGREETDKMIYFRNFYSIDSNYCAVRKGNEKGSVENAVGFAKRRFLGSNKIFKDFSELRKYLLDCSNKELDKKHYRHRSKTIKELLLEEVNLFKVLPERLLDASDISITKSSASSMICYDGVRYSIPSKYSQKEITLKAKADEIIIFDAKNCNSEIARHIRYHKFLNNEIYDFRHSLDVLFKKPRALDYAKCIKRSNFPKIFWDYLNGLKQHHRNANREMVKILLLEKYYSLKDIFFAMEWGVEHRTFSYDALKITLKDLNKESIRVESLNKTYPMTYDFKTDNSKYDSLI